MTDRYEKIRKALAMGPTPGPRRVSDEGSYPYVAVAMPENEGHRWDDPIICTLYEDVTPDDYIGFGECIQAFPNARANAALIAACDPDTVQALLDEYDALRGEVAEWKSVAVALYTEIERLREALGDILSRSSINLATRFDQFELTARLGDIYQIADAAREPSGPRKANGGTK